MIPGKCPDYETGYGSGIAIKSLNYGNSPVFLDGANKKPTRKIKGNFSMMNSKLYSSTVFSKGSMEFLTSVLITKLVAVKRFFYGVDNGKCVQAHCWKLVFRDNVNSHWNNMTNK